MVSFGKCLKEDLKLLTGWLMNIGWCYMGVHYELSMNYSKEY